MTAHRVRRLFEALCVMLAVGVLAGTQPAVAAAQAQTNFDVDIRYNDGAGARFSVTLDVYNKGPDNPGFTVISWYSVVIEFPTQSTPLSTGTPCDSIEYEFRGTYTVGICTIDPDYGTDLPVGYLKSIYLDFGGRPGPCDPVRTVTVTLRLDPYLRDPTPVHNTQQISGGITACDLQTNPA